MEYCYPSLFSTTVQLNRYVVVLLSVSTTSSNHPHVFPRKVHRVSRKVGTSVICKALKAGIVISGRNAEKLDAIVSSLPEANVVSVPADATDAKARRCSLTVSNPMLKAPVGSVLETIT